MTRFKDTVKTQAELLSDLAYHAKGVTDAQTLRDIVYSLTAALGTTATAAELDRVADVSGRVVIVSGNSSGSYSVVAATNEGRINALNDSSASVAVALPAATGSGAKYPFVVQCAATSSNSYTIAVPTSSGSIAGMAYGVDSSGSAHVYGTSATSDTFTFNGTTTGGQVGDTVEFVDLDTNKWAVHGTITISGSAATPFSAAV